MSIKATDAQLITQLEQRGYTASKWVSLTGNPPSDEGFHNTNLGVLYHVEQGVFTEPCEYGGWDVVEGVTHYQTIVQFKKDVIDELS